MAKERMEIVRRVLEPWVPYDRSVQWRIHHAYYATCGVAAWESNVVPSLGTSSAPAAEQQARVIVALVRSLLEEGRARPDEPVDILEVGCGPGRFAVELHRALDRELGEDGRDLARRLRYVLSDGAAHTLAQAIESPHLAELVARGRVIPAIFDLSLSRPALGLSGEPLALAPRVVIANYVACTLPCKQLRTSTAGDERSWDELLVELELAVPEASPHARRDADAILGDLLADPASAALAADLRRSYRWRPVALEAACEPLHAAVIERVVVGLPEAVLVYPHAFIDVLVRLQARLPAGSYVLVNDFGVACRESLVRDTHWAPVFYGSTMNNGLCFPVFDALADETGWRVWRTRDSLGAMHHAALRHAAEIPAHVRDALDRALVRDTRAAEYLDCVTAARACVRAGDRSVALRLLRRAADLAPWDVDLCCELAAHATDTGHAHVALPYLLGRVDRATDARQAATALHELGRAYAALGQHELSLRAFSASLMHEPREQTQAAMAMALRAANGRARGER